MRVNKSLLEISKLVLSQLNKYGYKLNLIRLGSGMKDVAKGRLLFLDRNAYSLIS